MGSMAPFVRSKKVFMSSLHSAYISSAHGARPTYITRSVRIHTAWFAVPTATTARRAVHLPAMVYDVSKCSGQGFGTFGMRERGSSRFLYESAGKTSRTRENRRNREGTEEAVQDRGLGCRHTS